jgi:formyltetrahydrofolate deformylase
MSLVMVISNHHDLADQAHSFGVPFLHVPATKHTRAQAERRQLDVLRDNVDLVVLARYMQIITPQFPADVERAVLSRAVLWHCEDRTIRYGN